MTDHLIQSRLFDFHSLLVTLVSFVDLDQSENCVPDPCNQNGATGESCDDGMCSCGAGPCPDLQLCVDGACQGV